MYHHSSKKRQLIVRSFVYGIMTLSVVAIVTILMLIILGYSFNRQDGRIEQGGLMQFASTPNGATVTLDEIAQSSRTPSKANVDAKNHHVTMDKTGYRQWQKSIMVEPGTIRWLSYARLIPTEPVVSSVHQYAGLDAALASPFRQWIAVQENATLPVITIADIRSEQLKQESITIPEESYTVATTEAPSTFTVESWAQDEKHMLVKHSYDTDQVEWLIVDRTDVSKTVNMSRTFAINPTKVLFGTNNGRNLYVKTDDIVRKVNLDDRTLSRPYVSNVEDFWVYDNTTVLYSTTPDPATTMRHVGYISDDMDEAVTIKSYPAETTNLKIAFGEYYNRNFVAVAHNTTMELFQGALPEGSSDGDLKLVKTQELTSPAEWLTISRNGRFIVAQRADGFTTYDVELKKADPTNFTRPSAGSQRQMQWLDDYMIWNDRENVLRFYEFDGANQQDIMPVTEGFSATLSSNNRYVYGFIKNEAGASLQRARLIIEN